MALTPLKAGRVVKEGFTQGIKAGKVNAGLGISR
jgi:hypothetical protein